MDGNVVDFLCCTYTHHKWVMHNGHACRWQLHGGHREIFFRLQRIHSLLCWTIVESQIDVLWVTWHFVLGAAAFLTLFRSNRFDIPFRRHHNIRFYVRHRGTFKNTGIETVPVLGTCSLHGFESAGWSTTDLYYWPRHLSRRSNLIL